jgi:hypothetical protein
MPLFAGKEAFKALGLEPVKKSQAHASQDCTICTDPLDIQQSLAKEDEFTSKAHAAVRIVACGHIVGAECLDAWLDIGCTCPTCNRVLFEPADDPITLQDIQFVVRELRAYFAKDTIVMRIARVVRRKKQEFARQQGIYGAEAGKMAVEEEDEFGISGDDFLDSDDEMGFEEEEEEEEADDDDEADEGYEDGEDEEEE